MLNSEIFYPVVSIAVSLIVGGTIIKAPGRKSILFNALVLLVGVVKMKIFPTLKIVSLFQFENPTGYQIGWNSYSTLIISVILVIFFSLLSRKNIISLIICGLLMSDVLFNLIQNMPIGDQIESVLIKVVLSLIILITVSYLMEKKIHKTTDDAEEYDDI